MILANNYKNILKKKIMIIFCKMNLIVYLNIIILIG